MCNIDPATDPAQHHRNDRKCIYDSDIPINGDGPKTQNGCPMNMPTLYPGTHRCFQTGPIVDGGPGGHWGGAMCNINPATDPAQHHRNDRKCIYGDGTKTKNGCTANMPTLYPGTHRCFQSGPIVDGGPGGHWGGAMCNIDPATDPAPHHRNDRKCVYDIPATDGPKTSNGCPQNMPTLYPGTHRCFQTGPAVNGGPGGHWGGAMCNIDPATDPALQNDRKCVYDIPATDGPKTSNGCPQNMPTLYPGTHRCFEFGPSVDGGPGGHWGGAMCNIDPATDPAPHHRNDRKCVYDNQVVWMVAPRDCQTCDEVCVGHGRVCEAGHLYPIQNETEVKKTAAMAGFTCTHYYRETWSVSEWDGPLLRLNSGLCVYNGNPIWKPSCSAKPACGYGHRLCPCRT